MAKSPLRPILLVPGILFWATVGVGYFTGSPVLVGVAIGLAVLTIVTAIALQVRAASRARAESEQIWRDGTPGRATVVSIGTAGGGINDHPRVDFELDVEVAGRPAYRASTQALISLLAVPRIQPGCVIEVRVSPTDPARVVVSPALTPTGTRPSPS